MRIPSLAEPRSAHKLEGRHVILFGAGAASEVEKGWELRQESGLVYRPGEATALIYARHGTVKTCKLICTQQSRPPNLSAARAELAKY